MIAPTYTRLINIVYNLAAHIIVEKEEKKNDFFFKYNYCTARCIIIPLYYSCCIVVVCVVSRISKLYIKMIVVLLFLSLSLSCSLSLSYSLLRDDVYFCGLMPVPLPFSTAASFVNFFPIFFDSS